MEALELECPGQATDIDNEKRLTDMVGEGEEGEGRMYGESNMETYITLCKMDSQWEFAVWFRELKPGLCNNLEGWDGEGGGKDVQEGRDICIPMADHVAAWQKPT